jgi:hypothetical protein
MESQLLFQCQVLNNDDPLMLGRIRARRLIDNYDDILKSISDPPWNEEKDIWTSRDPFIFNPLIPYYLYSTPKVDEMVLAMYANPGTKFINQYYIQSTFYSPTASGFQYYQGGNKFMGTGIQISNPLPLKNQDGTYPNFEVHKGVFPEPGDNSLLGRGSSDVIVKQDEILIRSGKFVGATLEPNVLPVADNKRGFLQISAFNQEKVSTAPSKITELVPKTLLVNYLIEYVILNPENTLDKFTGSIFLYQLKPDISVNSDNMSVNSVVPENLKILSFKDDFTALSKKDAINYINAFIKRCNSKNTSFDGKPLFSNSNDKFPMYYRPAKITYDAMNTSGIEQKNLSEIFASIKLYPALKGGSGLIYTQDKVGTPADIVTREIPKTNTLYKKTTVSALGSDKLFLLSHRSSIPGKGKINFSNTIYGISQEQFNDEILPKTSSLVRGEELMELLTLIVRFLVTHCHPYPGVSPVPTTIDGTQASEILTKLQGASNTILNTNIRLN